MRLFLPMFICLFLGGVVSEASALEVAHFRLIEAVGQVEVTDAEGGVWRAARPDTRLKPGMRVRTGDQSSADFAMDDYFENVLRLEARSRLAVLNDVPARVSLDEGSALILREDNHVADRFFGIPPRLRMLTRDFVAEMGHGGCRLFSDDAGSEVKVYGDSVKIYPRSDRGYSSQGITINEGFCYRLSGTRRLDYQDYTDWQLWYRQNDKRKDLFAERS